MIKEESTQRQYTEEEQALLNASVPPIPAEWKEELERETVRQRERHGIETTAENVWEKRIRKSREMVLRDWLPTGVPGDAWNIWNGNAQLLLADEPDVAKLQPVRTFEEYSTWKQSHDPAALEYIRTHGNPETIQKLDALGKEFMLELSPMRRVGGAQEALEFTRDAYRIIIGREPNF